MRTDIRNRSQAQPSVTKPADVEKANRFAVSAVALAVAKGIRSGEVEVGMITPLLLSLEQMAGPLQGGAPELMDDMRKAWDREKMADVDVEAGLRAFSKSIASPKPVIDRAALPELKGPAAEAPVQAVDRGVGR
jgi:hypothetical protein